jgi:hypothetical protein
VSIDEAISQIRNVRHIISEENGHDPQKLVKYYIGLQKKHSHLAKFKEELTEPVQAS